MKNTKYMVGPSFGVQVAEPLLTALSYDAESGIFRWVQPPKKARHVRPGDAAGTLTEQGYIRIKYEGVVHRAHRLAWLFAYGRWPSGQIDHINGVRSDNRIENLRDVPARTNSENRRRANANNGTGLLGVSRNGLRFSAVIGSAGRVTYLGTFDDPAEAHAVYLAAKARLHAGSTLNGVSVGGGRPPVMGSPIPSQLGGRLTPSRDAGCPPVLFQATQRGVVRVNPSINLRACHGADRHFFVRF